jgi:hypothetical protein
MRVGSSGVLLRFRHKLHRQFPVRRKVNIQRQVFYFDGLPDKQSVREIIFNQQKIQPSRSGFAELVRGR